METKIQLSVGEWKMRNGEKALVEYKHKGLLYPWHGYIDAGVPKTWRDDGFEQSTMNSPFDIISHWTSPIAPSHNPDKLTVEQVGDGWWLPEWEVLEKVSPALKIKHFEVWFDGKWWNTPFRKDTGPENSSTYRTCLTRKELLKLIAPKKRLIRVEELPPVCWVGDESDHWLVVKREKYNQKIHSPWQCFTVQGLANGNATWSSDLTTWNSFKVEDK